MLASPAEFNKECVAEMHRLAISTSQERFDDDGEERAVEDMIVKNKLLEARNAEMLHTRTKMEEENGFLKHQIKLRDRRMEASATTLSKLEATIAQLQKLVDEKDRTLNQHKLSKNDLLTRIDNLTTENFELQVICDKASQNSSYLNAPTSKKTDHYAQLLEHKINCVTLRRRLREARGRYMDAMAKGEARAMEVEDHRSYINDLAIKNGGNYVVNLKNFARRVSSASATNEIEEPQSETEGANIEAYYRSTNKPKIFGGPRTEIGNFGIGPDVFPAQPLEMYTQAEMEFMASKYRQSAYGTLLKDTEIEMSLVATRAKELHDKNQNALWHVFTEATRRGGCVLSNPRQDYTSQLATTLREYNKTTRELLKVFRDNSAKMINYERTVKEKMEADFRASLNKNKVSIGTQVDMENPEMLELAEKVAFLEQVQLDTQEKHFKDMAKLEEARAKAEINQQYLQSKVFELHESIHDALSAVHRHRFQWIGALPNTFSELFSAPDDKSPARNISSKTIHYNLRIGGAIDEDRKLLGKFAHYFLSKELFGTVVQPTSASVNGAQPVRGGTNAPISVTDELREYQRSTAARARMTQQKQTAKSTLEAAQRLLKKEEKEMKQSQRKQGSCIPDARKSNDQRVTGFTNISCAQGLSLPLTVQVSSKSTDDDNDNVSIEPMTQETAISPSSSNADTENTNDALLVAIDDQRNNGPFGTVGDTVGPSQHDSRERNSNMDSLAAAAEGQIPVCVFAQQPCKIEPNAVGLSVGEFVEPISVTPSYRIPSAPASRRPSPVRKISEYNFVQATSNCPDRDRYPAEVGGCKKESSPSSSAQGSTVATSILNPSQPSTPVGKIHSTTAPRKRASTFAHAASATAKPNEPASSSTRPSTPTRVAISNGTVPNTSFAFPLPAHCSSNSSVVSPTAASQQPFTRMELWQKQQQDQWERKRQATLAGTAPTIVYVTSIMNKENAPTTPTTAPITIDASKWMVGLSKNQCLTTSSSPGSNSSVLPLIGGSHNNGTLLKSQALATRKNNNK